jgi:hypothetical protein
MAIVNQWRNDTLANCDQKGTHFYLRAHALSLLLIFVSRKRTKDMMN